MLTAAQVEQYQENGCLVVEGVLHEEEIAPIRTVVDALVEASRGVSENDALYDLEDGHGAERPMVRRLKDPDRHHAVFRALRSQPRVVALLETLWGTGVRFDKAKLNMKAPGFGSAVEWHQDWAFYPHTNDDLAAVGFMLDDMSEENGPLLVIPGSHRGPVYDHHAGGFFCGAIDAAREGLGTDAAVALTGPAGSVTVHHVRAVHGSAPNRSHRPRRLLLHQYCAADAWPLMGVGDYRAFRAGLCSGEESVVPRTVPLPVRMPLPAALHQGSIYENQRELEARFFDDAGGARSEVAT